MNEHEIEPVRGLPERLPQGEHMLWQGAPDWRSLAIRALHVRAVFAYFAVVFAWSVFAGMAEGSSAIDALIVAARLVPLAAAAGGILALYAYFVHRTTVYTITNRRVVMRFGVALPMTLNVPYAIIGGAAVRVYGDGTADVPLELTGKGRIAYLALWPHARPWQLSKPQPMLRAVPDGERVAQVLKDALREASGRDAIGAADVAAPDLPACQPQAA